MTISDAGGEVRRAGAVSFELPDVLTNIVDGSRTTPMSGPTTVVHDPATGEAIRTVEMSDVAQVDAAVASAVRAQAEWRQVSLADRAGVMYDIRDVLRTNIDALAETITQENGKTLADAVGEVRRGLESIEYACGLPTNVIGDFSRDAARGVDVHSVREPLGVVGCITPFNFPVMVPLWMLANALSTGNAAVLKPSEKDPGSSMLLAELMVEAGLPAGVLNVVNGDRTAVDRLIAHPDVAALSFVGSTPVAQAVSRAASDAGKRVQALGGAKNHMVVMPDADMDAAASAAVGAAFGAAGERCMAVSVVVTVGSAADELLPRIEERMRRLTVAGGREAGADLGPLITQEHRDRVAGFIPSAAEAGATVVVDGREHETLARSGFFLGPTLIDHVTPDMDVYRHEVFGPVLSVVRVDELDEAIAMTNANPFGNGTAIFTRDGGAARRFEATVDIGMVGVNVPIPVPVGWFSFGGWKSSLFGDAHMYGSEGARFFTRQKVVTSRW